MCAYPVLNAGNVQGGMSSNIDCRAIHLSYKGTVNDIFHLHFQAVYIFSHLVLCKGSFSPFCF